MSRKREANPFKQANIACCFCLYLPLNPIYLAIIASFPGLRRWYCRSYVARRLRYWAMEIKVILCSPLAALPVCATRVDWSAVHSPLSAPPSSNPLGLMRLTPQASAPHPSLMLQRPKHLSFSLWRSAVAPVHRLPAGRAQALNLRDSGVAVIVGACMQMGTCALVWHTCCASLHVPTVWHTCSASLHSPTVWHLFIACQQ